MTTGACGFIFSHAPPEGHEEMDYFTCTDNNAGPIIDVIWASLNVLGALVAAGDPDAYENSSQIIAVGLSWGVLSGAAAGVGFNKTKKCKAAKRAQAQRQGQGAREDTRAGDTVVQAVVVSPDAATLTVGQRIQLVATALNSSGGSVPNKMFTWSSSNDAIASVNNAGQVTAHAVGSVVIAANTDNIVGTTNVVVRSQH
jgi:uncharacterized protein YjdB